MQITHYSSKRIGPITISTELNQNSMTIVTDKLSMSSFNQHSREELSKVLFDLFSNPEHMKWFVQGTPWDKTKVDDYIEKQVELLANSSPWCDFIVRLKETGELIGLLIVDDVTGYFEKHPRAIEVGFILKKEHWGKGFATSMTVAAKKYIKDVIHNRKVTPSPLEIIGTAHPENKASCIVLERTLKLKEPDILNRYGKERYFFFKKLGSPSETRPESSALCHN